MTQIPPPAVRFDTPRDEVLSIQYLRGFAALSVLITHALQWPLAELNMALLKTGRLGVEVFFVISGFIITIIAGDGPFSPKTFLSRRAFRIIPTYWAATLLITCLALMMPSQFRTTIPTIEGFVKSLLFIPSLEPKAPLLLLGWTLNFEAFFYLVFASLFFLKSGMRTVVLFGLFACLVAIGQALTEPTHLEAIYTSPSLIGFIFGTALAQAYRHGMIARLGKYAQYLVVAAPFALVTAYYAIPWESAEHVVLWKHILMSLGAFSIVLLALACEAQNRMPYVNLLKYLGDGSYSLYLFHIFSVAAVWAVMKRLFDVKQPLTYMAGTAIAILAGLAFGLLCHHLVERPLLMVGRKWRRAALPA
jgi:exopolysaccharide production protein ExoZ